MQTSSNGSATAPASSLESLRRQHTSQASDPGNGGNGHHSKQSAGSETGDAVGSAGDQRNSGDLEKGINQLAIARMRSMDRRDGGTQRGSDGTSSSANGSGGDVSPGVSAVTQPVQQVGERVGQVLALSCCFYAFALA